MTLRHRMREQMRWHSLLRKIKHRKCADQPLSLIDIRTLNQTKKWKKAAEKVVVNGTRVAILDKMMLEKAVLIKEAHKQKKVDLSIAQVHCQRERNSNRVHHHLCKNHWRNRKLWIKRRSKCPRVRIGSKNLALNSSTWTLAHPSTKKITMA